MSQRPIEEIKTIEDVNFEMSETKHRLKDLPKKVVKEIFILTGLAILFPFIPGKRGRKPMVENWEYSNALIFVAILFTLTYIIAYYWRKDKLIKRIRDLKLKEHLLQKKKFK
jgi:hypothetical protein